MRLSRRAFILTGMAAACSRPAAKGPLQAAAEYLWAQQAEDGGFHSSTYGLLRSGQSLTPFILNGLLDVPLQTFSPPREGVDRALEFIRRNTDTEGVLGRMDPTAPDYPNYATALAVVALVKSRRSGFESLVQRMVEELRRQQFSEANGWAEDSPPYGGWGMGGAVRRPPDAGHVDLSMTRYVLEALRAAGVSPGDPALTRALIFLDRTRNADHGFYFSPVNPEINKAGESGAAFRSYGTATADGVLALRAAGVPETDSRIANAVQWLRDHHRVDAAPGFDELDAASSTEDRPATSARAAWSEGLRFYYAHVATRALPDLEVRLPRPEADGRFVNASNLVKEDDPLIATTFAIHVLART